MDSVQLRIGDRIALLQAYAIFPAGAQGAITYIYKTEPGLYRVRFDTNAYELPVYIHYLNQLHCRADTPDGRARDA